MQNAEQENKLPDIATPETIEQSPSDVGNDSITAQKPKSGSRLYPMLAVPLTLLLGLIAVMDYFNYAYLIPFVSIASLSLLSLSLLTLGFGIHFKRTAVKMISFCLVAVLAALTFVSVYIDIRGPKGVIRYTLEAGDLDESGHVRDDAAARAIFAEFGRKAAADAVTETYMNEPDALLGYRMLSGVSEVMSIKVHDSNKLVYLAAYHLNEYAWRVTPQAPKATKAAVFLGDSFTFGIGLEDVDTYPYKVGEALGGDWQVFNFGVGGWGSHQALAMLENGYLDDIAERYDELHVFFMTLDSHGERVAGEAFWDKDGPCYRLQPDGSVKYIGSFADVQEAESSDSTPPGNYTANEKKQLMLAIFRQMDSVLQERYGIRLVLIDPFGWAPSLGTLNAEGVEIIDAYVGDAADYVIPGDGHPNALGTDLFAEKIVKHIYE